MAYAAGLDVEMGGAPSDLAPAELDPRTARPSTRRRRRGARARAEGVARTLRRPRTSRGGRADRADRGCPSTRARGGHPIDGAAEERRHAAARATRAACCVTGPYAESTDHLGAWTQSFAAPARSIADELRARLPRAEIRVVPGVGVPRRRRPRHPGGRRCGARERRRAGLRGRAELPLGRGRVAQRPAPARAAGGADPAGRRYGGALRRRAGERAAARRRRTGSMRRPPSSRRGTAAPRRPPRSSTCCSATPIPPDGCRCRSLDRSGRSRSTTRTRAPAGPRAGGLADRVIRRHRAARSRQRAREVHLEVPRPRPRSAVRVRARLGLRGVLARRATGLARRGRPRRAGARRDRQGRARRHQHVRPPRRRGDPGVPRGRRGERRSAGAPARRVRAAHASSPAAP